MTEEEKWELRFKNYSRAFTLLREMVEENEDLSKLDPIVKEGTIHRFQYAFELAWKTLKDKMEYDGLPIDKISPKPVFKLAYQSKYINNIELWLNMTNDKNLMSHTYDFATFDKVLQNIQKDYFPLLSDLYIYFIEEQIK